VPGRRPRDHDRLFSFSAGPPWKEDGTIFTSPVRAVRGGW
jgi:hypothetical protein